MRQTEVGEWLHGLPGQKPPGFILRCGCRQEIPAILFLNEITSFFLSYLRYIGGNPYACKYQPSAYRRSPTSNPHIVAGAIIMGTARSVTKLREALAAKYW